LSRNELTTASFDRATAHAPRARMIWTAEGIAAKIGCSADYVRSTLAHLEGSPVRKIGSRYVAYEPDLIAFFRTQPTQP
jgi:hypothetical protein